MSLVTASSTKVEMLEVYQQCFGGAQRVRSEMAIRDWAKDFKIAAS